MTIDELYRRAEGRRINITNDERRVAVYAWSKCDSHSEAKYLTDKPADGDIADAVLWCLGHVRAWEERQDAGG